MTLKERGEAARWIQQHLQSPDLELRVEPGTRLDEIEVEVSRRGVVLLFEFSAWETRCWKNNALRAQHLGKIASWEGGPEAVAARIVQAVLGYLDS